MRYEPKEEEEKLFGAEKVIMYVYVMCHIVLRDSFAH